MTTITFAMALSYLGGLRGLENHRRIIKDSGNEKVASLPPLFAPDALLPIVINTNRLTAVQKDFQEANAKLVRGISGGKEMIAPPQGPGADADEEAKAAHRADMAAYQDQMARYQAEAEALHKQEIDVDLRQIPAWALRLEDHALSPSALAAIEPLIDWDAKAPAPKDEKKKAA